MYCIIGSVTATDLLKTYNFNCFVICRNKNYRIDSILQLKHYKHVDTV